MKGYANSPPPPSNHQGMYQGCAVLQGSGRYAVTVPRLSTSHTIGGSRDASLILIAFKKKIKKTAASDWMKYTLRLF